MKSKKPSFGSLNQISDLINKFEHAQPKYQNNTNAPRKKVSKKTKNPFAGGKMCDSMDDNELMVDSSEFEVIDSGDDENNVYAFAAVEQPPIRHTKMQRLKNIGIIRCQLDLFQRFVGILLSFPFLASVNGAGFTTLTCAFFLPRFLCEHILYPIFRLLFGTLYPAYASYKAVRNKDVKEYVSDVDVSFELEQCVELIPAIFVFWGAAKNKRSQRFFFVLHKSRRLFVFYEADFNNYFTDFSTLWWTEPKFEMCVNSSQSKKVCEIFMEQFKNNPRQRAKVLSLIFFFTAEVDHVLDCVCVFHMLRNIHRHFPVVVPILLWTESGHRYMATVTGYRRQLGALSKFRASDAHQTRKGLFCKKKKFLFGF